MLVFAILQPRSRSARNTRWPRGVGATAFFGALLATIGAAHGATFIQGYAGSQSVVPGDGLAFHVSTNAPSFSIEIYRDAWTPVLIDTLSGLTGVNHGIPAEGWLGANWPVAHTWTVPANAETGSYYARLVAQDGTSSKCPFIIRRAVPGSLSRIAYVMNYNTRNAYNYWGGKSLYVGPAVAVSFLRPYFDENGLGKGAFLTTAMHGFLETDGFVLEYITELDIHAIPDLLDAYDVLVMAGHHEYISRPFYDAVQAHHDRGGHLAVFSANDFWWQVRFEQNGNLMVCYKSSAIPNDPMYGVDNSLVTVHWYEEILNRPGEALQGIAFNWSGAFQAEPYLVQDASHWIFAGTGAQDGDAFGNLMASGEQDFIGPASPPVMDVILHARRARPGQGSPPPVAYADGCAIYYEDSPAYGFPNGRGGQVFSSGSQTWPSNLFTGVPGYLAVRRATRNIIQHMVAAPPPPLLGDMNDDRRVDRTDVNQFLGAMLGLDADAGRRTRADWDRNGTVDVADLRCMADGLVGLRPRPDRSSPALRRRDSGPLCIGELEARQTRRPE